MSLTKKKVTILALSFITAISTLFGALLLTPKTAKADDSTTTSEYSTWTKTPVKVGDDLLNKVIAFDINYDETVSGKVFTTIALDYGEDFVLINTNSNVIAFDCIKIDGSPYTAENLETIMADGFAVYTLSAAMFDNVTSLTYMGFFDLNGEGVLYEESIDALYILTEVPPEDTETPKDETPKDETPKDETPLSDKIKEWLENATNWFNDNTGLGLSSSIVGLAIVIIIISILRRRR